MMAVHPYRTAPPAAEIDDADASGLHLALGVLALVGAVQLVSGFVAGPPSLETAFGAACFVASLVWLRRHRR